MNTKPSDDNFENENENEKGEASETAQAFEEARRKAHRFGRALAGVLQILGPTAARIAIDLITDDHSHGEGD